MSNEVRIRSTFDDQASAPLKHLHANLEKLQSVSAKGFAIGAGVAATSFALNSVGMAIGAVTGFLTESVGKYGEQEVATDRLTASLKANAAGWNGDMTAIDAANAAGQRLGFDNTDLTNSLAGLVGATHDVGKAIDIQGVAMDLARYKGLSLVDATEALTRVEAGSYRILKSLGIELATHSTQTQALAAVEKIAGGQAQTYANTDLGQIAIASATVQDAQEKMGKTLLHIGAAVVPRAANALNDFIDGLGRLGDATKKENDSIVNFIRWVLLLDPAVEGSANRAENLGLKLAYAADQGDNASDRMAYLTAKTNDLGGATDAVATGIGKIPAATKKALYGLELMKKSLQDSSSATNDLVNQLSGLSSSKYDVAILLGDYEQASRDLNDIIKQGPLHVGEAGVDMEIWQGQLGAAQKKVQDLQGQLALAEGPQSFNTWLLTLGKSLDLTNPKVAAMWSLILATASATKNLPPMSVGGRVGHTSIFQRAAGGPVSAGTPYTVGEAGPEMFVPSTNGTIIPTPALRAMGSGGSTVNYNLTVQGNLMARDPHEVLAVLRRMQAITT